MEGKSGDDVCEKLKEFKDMYYHKVLDNDVVFFIIKRIEYVSCATDVEDTRNWLRHLKA